MGLGSNGKKVLYSLNLGTRANVATIAASLRRLATASLLTETSSKNMAVLTLDRRYAQRRDRVRGEMRDGEVTFVGGVESGVVQLVRGVVEGVAGVVKAPMRGAERNGVEGFAKGIGKGLLGLVVKPMIGISDAETDFRSSTQNRGGNACGN
jgi:hypothetical protein